MEGLLTAVLSNQGWSNGQSMGSEMIDSSKHKICNNHDYMLLLSFVSLAPGPLPLFHWCILKSRRAWEVKSRGQLRNRSVQQGIEPYTWTVKNWVSSPICVVFHCYRFTSIFGGTIDGITNVIDQEFSLPIIGFKVQASSFEDSDGCAHKLHLCLVGSMICQANPPMWLHTVLYLAVRNDHTIDRTWFCLSGRQNFQRASLKN